MRTVAAAFLLTAYAPVIYALDPQLTERAKQEEQRSCTPCHSLRIIESQRLSAAAWSKELDKMIGWGTAVSERQLLLDYLSEQFSPTKPMSPSQMTANSSNGQSDAAPGTRH